MWTESVAVLLTHALRSGDWVGERLAISRQSGHYACVMSGHEIARKSLQAALLIGCLFGIGAAIGSRSIGLAVVNFLVVALFVGSLTLVARPRRLRAKNANHAGSGVIGDVTPHDRKQLLSKSYLAIVKEKGSADPELVPVVHAMSAVLRNAPVFDGAALWVPCAWIALLLIRSGVLLVRADLGSGVGGLVVLVVPALAILARALAGGVTRDAAVAYAATPTTA